VLPPSVVVQRPAQRTAQVERMVGAFQLNLAVLSWVGLLIGMFLVYNTMSFSVAQRRREIGIYRALGMAERRVAGLFLVEAGLFGFLGGLLGSVRDLDVLLEHLDADSTSLEDADARAFRRLRKRLVTQREDARASMLEGMTTDRYLGLLDLLEGAADAPGTGEAVPLDAIAAGAYDRLRKKASTLPKRPTDDELHDVRIATKRARYAAELAEPVLKKAGSRFIERAKVLQDVIGEHQDACVAEDRIRDLARRSGGTTGVAAGRLVEQQQRRKQAARRAYRDAWRRLEQAGRKAFRS